MASSAVPKDNMGHLMLPALNCSRTTGVVWYGQEVVPMIALAATAETRPSIFGGNIDLFIYERLLPNLLIIFLYIVVGMLLIRIIGKILDRSIRKKLNPQSQMLIKKSVSFIGTFVIAILVLDRLEVPLSAMLGTAGIATVAIGIAAQNSLGNIISGIFLLSEHSFQVGDLIQVGAYIGTVTSVDLLSVKIQTFDGLHLRIPNETLIKSEITTITKNKIRRVPLEIGISFYDNIEKARDVLFSVAEAEPLALKDPAPFFMVSGFGSSSINLFFAVWGETANFALLKTALLINIKKAFDEAGIEIPFPHVTLRPAVSLKGLDTTELKKQKEESQHVSVVHEEPKMEPLAGYEEGPVNR
ncbi:MAG TPA: mechanosensitive ion channel protein [Sphaerochaeta sp.]|nr:mechanosensitive ion channel protein [Sphaerochaeta sp.]